MPVPSSKSDMIRKKLRACGKMQAFQERKLEFENEGLSKHTAYNKAVSEFTQYFTFDDHKDSDSGDSGGDVKLPGFVCLNKKDFADKKAVADKEAITWAIDNVAFKDVGSRDAPNSTAWLYLKLFREDGMFLRDCLKKRVPNISKEEEDGGHIDDGRKQFTLIDKLVNESRDDADSGMVRDNDGVLPKALSGSNQT